MPKSLTIEDVALCADCEADNVLSIRSLSIYKGQFDHVDVLKHCPFLEYLFLSRSRLSSMSSLHFLRGLRVLDLSFNNISSLPDAGFWANFPMLEVIYLHGNKIKSIKNLLGIRACPNLRVVTCFANPVSSHPSYRHIIVNSILTLDALDGYVVADEEVIEGLRSLANFRKLAPQFLMSFQFPSKEAYEALNMVHDKKFEICDLPTNSFSECHKYLLALRKEVHKIQHYHSPILIIQRHFRGYLVRRDLRVEILEKHRAAVTIQRFWRAYKEKQRKKLVKQVIVIQRVFRGYMERKNYRLLKKRLLREIDGSAIVYLLPRFLQPLLELVRIKISAMGISPEEVSENISFRFSNYVYQGRTVPSKVADFLVERVPIFIDLEEGITVRQHGNTLLMRHRDFINRCLSNAAIDPLRFEAVHGNVYNKSKYHKDFLDTYELIHHPMRWLFQDDFFDYFSKLSLKETPFRNRLIAVRLSGIFASVADLPPKLKEKSDPTCLFLTRTELKEACAPSVIANAFLRYKASLNVQLYRRWFNNAALNCILNTYNKYRARRSLEFRRRIVPAVLMITEPSFVIASRFFEEVNTLLEKRRTLPEQDFTAKIFTSKKKGSLIVSVLQLEGLLPFDWLSAINEQVDVTDCTVLSSFNMRTTSLTSLGSTIPAVLNLRGARLATGREVAPLLKHTGSIIKDLTEGFYVPLVTEQEPKKENNSYHSLIRRSSVSLGGPSESRISGVSHQPSFLGNEIQEEEERTVLFTEYGYSTSLYNIDDRPSEIPVFLNDKVRKLESERLPQALDSFFVVHCNSVSEARLRAYCFYSMLSDITPSCLLRPIKATSGTNDNERKVESGESMRFGMFSAPKPENTIAHFLAQEAERNQFMKKQSTEFGGVSSRFPPPQTGVSEHTRMRIDLGTPVVEDNVLISGRSRLDEHQLLDGDFLMNTATPAMVEVEEEETMLVGKRLNLTEYRDIKRLDKSQLQIVGLEDRLRISTILDIQKQQQLEENQEKVAAVRAWKSYTKRPVEEDRAAMNKAEKRLNETLVEEIAIATMREKREKMKKVAEPTVHAISNAKKQDEDAKLREKLHREEQKRVDKARTEANDAHKRRTMQLANERKRTRVQSENKVVNKRRANQFARKVNQLSSHLKTWRHSHMRAVADEESKKKIADMRTERQRRQKIAKEQKKNKRKVSLRSKSSLALVDISSPVPDKLGDLRKLDLTASVGPQTDRKPVKISTTVLEL
ncbi:hypothetical protein PCE1_002993 [Barthelona sp. PCE]